MAEIGRLGHQIDADAQAQAGVVEGVQVAQVVEIVAVGLELKRPQIIEAEKDGDGGVQRRGAELAELIQFAQQPLLIAKTDVGTAVVPHQAGMVLLLRQQGGAPAEVDDVVGPFGDGVPHPQPGRAGADARIDVPPVDIPTLLLHDPERPLLQAAHQGMGHALHHRFAHVVGVDGVVLAGVAARRVQNLPPAVRVARGVVVPGDEVERLGQIKLV